MGKKQSNVSTAGAVWQCLDGGADDNFIADDALFNNTFKTALPRIGIDSPALGTDSTRIINSTKQLRKMLNAGI